MTYSGLATIALAAALASAAQAQEPIPEREASLVVYGDDPCPAAADEEEIVVCARRPEEERYRIPEPLRREGQRPAASWSVNAAALEEAQRDTRPDSCSVVGSNGQTGCSQAFIRQWRAERRARPRGR